MGRQKKREPVNQIWYSATDQRWHGEIKVGIKPNGRPDMRHRSSKDPERVKAALIKLEDEREAGTVGPAGKRMKLGPLMDFWLAEIAPMRSSYRTLEIRERNIRLYLKPRLGEHWTELLQTGHVEYLYASLTKEGLSPKSIALVHETLMLVLNKAKDWGMAGDPVAASADRPSIVETEIEPLNAAEIAAVLGVVRNRRNFARWILGFLGARQGEVLGSKWEYLEDDSVLNIVDQAQRRKYEHGCADAKSCAAKHCVTKPCEGPWQHGCPDPTACAQPHCQRPTYPSDIKRGIRVTECDPGCVKHAKACPERRRGPCAKKRHKKCPKLCKPGCTGHAKACPKRLGGVILVSSTVNVEDSPTATPKRRGGRRVTKRSKKVATKTRAGTRRLAIPKMFRPAFEEQRRQQERDRRMAGTKWKEHGLIVCTEFGMPLDRSADWRDWAEILEDAGVDHLPVHALRHTAATLLLALKVDSRIVMSMLGWKDERMLTRYQHVADELRGEAADLLGAFIGTTGSTTKTTTIDSEDVLDEFIAMAS